MSSVEPIRPSMIKTLKPFSLLTKTSPTDSEDSTKISPSRRNFFSTLAKKEPATSPTASAAQTETDFKTLTSSATISFVNASKLVKPTVTDSPKAERIDSPKDDVKFKSTKVFAAPKTLLSFNAGSIYEEQKQKSDTIETKPNIGSVSQLKITKPSSFHVNANYKTENLAVNKSVPICNRYRKTASPSKLTNFDQVTSSKIYATTGTNTDIDKVDVAAKINSEQVKVLPSPMKPAHSVSIGTMTENESSPILSEPVAKNDSLALDVCKKTTATTATSTSSLNELLVEPVKVSTETQANGSLRSESSDFEAMLTSSENTRSSSSIMLSNSDKQKSFDSTSDSAMPNKQTGSPLLFDLESFFSYWITRSGSNAPDRGDNPDENNEALKEMIVKVLKESMTDLKSEQSFSKKIETKSQRRQMSELIKNQHEAFNTRPSDRVSLLNKF